MNLTRPQVAALRQLARNGASPTSTSTDGKYIGGPVAAALMRRKLASGRFHTIDRLTGYCDDYRVEITDAGREALALHDQNGKV